jgi:hypothetical protein
LVSAQEEDVRRTTQSHDDKRDTVLKEDKPSARSQFSFELGRRELVYAMNPHGKRSPAFGLGFAPTPEQHFLR